MKKCYPKLRFAVEITKDEPEKYLQNELEVLQERCKRWGIEMQS